MGFSPNVRELPCLELNVNLPLSSSTPLPPCRTNHPPFQTFIAEATSTLQPLPWVRSAGKNLSEENTVKQSPSAEEASEAELASGMCPSTVAVATDDHSRPMLSGWKRPLDVIAKNKLRWRLWPHLVPGGRLRMDTNMLILIAEHVLDFQEFCVWGWCLQSSGKEAMPST